MDNLILKATKIAKKVHAEQTRDYGKGPYIHHPARVASRVMLLDDATPEMVAAAMNHDALEDGWKHTWLSKEYLAKELSPIVANLVDELTNKYTKTTHPNLNRKARKNKEVERLGSVSSTAKVIKMLDRLDNLQDIDLDDSFSLTYANESVELLEKIKDANAEIAEELERRIYEIKWHWHTQECDSCQFFPLSPACDSGKEILKKSF